MVAQEVAVDQEGFPVASEPRTTRQAPVRSRSRSTPQRSKSATDAGLSPLQSPNKATDVPTAHSKSGAADIASPHRRSPRRCKSSDGHDKELMDLAKAQMAMSAALHPTPSLAGEKVKMKVIVRKKKSSKDPNRTPSPGTKNRRVFKVPAGALDLAAFDPTKDEKSQSSPRGREALNRERRVRSSSRRSTRSRSRGRMQSVKINLNEDESDTEEVDDGLDEDHTSPKAETRSLGRKSDSVTAPPLSPLENGKGDVGAPPKSPMRENGARDRFTTASEWSNVVDDLIQKRTDGKDSEKDDPKSKSKGLGRLFGSNRK